MLKITPFLLFFFVMQFSLDYRYNDCEKNENNMVQGTIQLSGEEALQLGTSLTVAYIEVANTSLTGTDKSVMLLSDNIRVENNELVFDESKQSGFVIVASDFSTDASLDTEKAISMNITRDGQEYLYACSSPFRNFFIACGESYVVDFEAETVTFENTTVINTDNDKVLTLDGSISW